MPRAFDTATLNALYDPNRSDVNFKDLRETHNLAELLIEGIEWVFDAIIEQFGELLGFDFTEFLEAVHNAITNLETIFGSLNPFGGEFNPMLAIQAFLDLMGELVIKIPMSLIDGLVDWFFGFLTDTPILEQIVAAFTGLAGGLQDIVEWVETIPLIGPIIEAITGIIGGTLDTLRSWFTDLLGIFGNPSGLGSGNPVIDALENIPILGPVIESMVGIGDLVFSIIGSFGDLPDLAEFFAGLSGAVGSLVEHIAHAITGLWGDLEDIGAFINSLLPWNWFRASERKQVNLCIDANFEDTTIDHGDTPTGERSTDVARSGTHSWKSPFQAWTGFTLGAGSNAHPLNVSEGQQFYVEAWVYRPNANSNNGHFMLGRGFKNTGAADYAWATQGFAQVDIPKQTWTKVSTYFTVPAGMDLGYFFFQWHENATAGDIIYVDDIVVREETANQGLIAAILGEDGFLSDVVEFFTGIPASIGSILDQIANAITGMFGDFDDIAAFISTLLPWNWFKADKATQANLCIDPSFEDTTMPARGSGSYSTDITAHSGTHTWKIPYSYQYQGITFAPSPSIGDDLKVAAGQKFYAECWVYRPNGNSDAGTLKISSRFRDSATLTPSYWGDSIPQSSIPKGVWTKMSNYFEVPADKDLGVIYFEWSMPATAGDIIYVDDILVREETAPQNLIQAITGIAGGVVADVVEFFSGIGAGVGSLLDQISDAITGLPGTLQSIADFIATLLPWNWFRAKEKAGSNLVLDPSFEDTTITRTLHGSGGYSTDTAHSGTHSYKLGRGAYIGLTGDWDVPSTHMRAKPGDIFEMSAWVYRPSGNSSGGGYGIGIDAFTEGGGSSSGQGWAGGNQSELPYDTWTFITGYTDPMPAGTQTVCAFAQLNYTGVADTDWMYYDDIIVREVTASGNIIESILGTGGLWFSDVAEFFGGIAASAGSILEQIIEAITGFAGNAWQNVTDFINGLLPWNAFNAKTRGGSNLVINGDFENTSYTYDPDVGVVSTDVSHSGTRCFKTIAYDWGNSYLAWYPDVWANANYIKVQPGQTYLFEAYVAGWSGNQGGGSMHLRYGLFDSKGVNGEQWGDWCTPTANPAGGTGWVKLSGKYTIPAGYDLLAPHIWIDDGSATGDVMYIDDVWLSEETGSQNIIDSLIGGAGHAVTELVNHLLPWNWFRGAQGPNLIIDPSFEDTNIARVTYGNSVRLQDTDAHTGAYDWQLTASSGGWDEITFTGVNDGTAYCEYIDVVPGMKFYCEVYVWRSGSNTDTGTIYFGAACYDKKTWSGGFVGESYNQSSIAKAQWVKLSQYITIPAGKDRARIYIGLDPSIPNDERFWIDDALVREETASQGVLATVTDWFQDLIDNLIEGITGIPIIGGLISDVIEGFQSFMTMLFGGVEPQKQVQVAAVPDIAPFNLVVDGSFETSTVERTWSSNGRVAYTTEDKHSGVRCMKFMPNGVNETDWAILPMSASDAWDAAHAFKVQPGQRYYIEYWVKGNSGNDGYDTSTSGIWCWFTHSINGGGGHEYDNGPENDTIYFSTPAGGFDWKKCYGYVTVPAGMDRWVPYVYIRSGVPSGDIFYVDDMQVRIAEAKSMIDDVVASVSGGTGIDYPHTEAAEALLSQNQAVTQHASTIQGILARLNAGVAITDDFERTTSYGTFGNNWHIHMSGGNNCWCDGHNAVIWSTANGNDDILCRWQTTDPQVTNSDYQTVTVVLATAPNGAGGGYASNDVWARFDTNMDYGVRFRVSSTKAWSLARKVNGSFTDIATGTLASVPGGGSTLTLIAGNKAGSAPRSFKCLVNGTPLHTDWLTDTVSYYGASYRYSGFGGRCDYQWFQTSSPGWVNYWSGQDTE